MTKVRWGIISTAAIGVNSVIPGAQAGETGEVVAIASRNQARAETIAQRLGIPHALGSYEELLDAVDIHAIYNPLPNHLHAEWTKRAADAGKHVLCEKPLGLDAAEAQEIADHCAAAGVLLQEAFMYRFHPQWLGVRRLVVAGRIGELRAVQTWFSYFNDDPENIRNVAEYGGGALMDIGCYPISVARLLFDGEPDEVTAVMQRDPRFGVDVLTSAVLRFGTAHAGFTVSTQAQPFQRVHIVGTEGRIEVEIPFNAPKDVPTRILVTNGMARETVSFAPADHYRLQVDAFGRAILDGTPAPLPPSDAIANMAVIDRVRAAAGA